MPEFTVKQDAPFLKAPDLRSERLGIVRAGLDLQGEEANGFVRTRLDALAVGDGFVPFQALQDKPSRPQPITADGLGAFVALVTRLAREAGADRDYLLAVAYAGTANLTQLGEPGADRLGPFQLSQAEWLEAITAGPAKGRGFTAEDRYRWSCQAEVAACLAADGARRLAQALGAAPRFAELHFALRFGPGAVDLLKGERAARCRDLVRNPAPGSYAALLAAGDDTVAQAIARLEAALVEAYRVARVEIDKQPPAIRFFRPGEGLQAGEPPWLAVARAERVRGVAETPDGRNTDDIKVYLRAAGLDDLSGTTPWCGAFLAFCVKTCGVPEAAGTIRVGAALASWWESWGEAVAPPYPPGTILVLNDSQGQAGHVGLAVGGDAATVQVLGGNQGNPGRVSIVPFVRGSVRSARLLRLPAPSAPPGIAIDSVALQQAGVVATSGDADFVARAPAVMRDLMADLPGLTAVQAAAILGNIGHECGGFRELAQIGLPVGQAGMGWCQWDGARRDAFLAWARDRNQDWRSPEANYSYLVQELRSTEVNALRELLRETSLEGAVISFDRCFERSGVKALDRRLRFARLALAAFGGATP